MKIGEQNGPSIMARGFSRRADVETPYIIDGRSLTPEQIPELR